MSMEPSSSADDKDKTEPETALDDKRDMAPASDRPINDDDDDKTEPVPEQLTRTSSGEPDGKCEEDYASGEPADLSTKNQKEEEHPVERPFRLDPEDVARFSRDPAQWLKTFRVPAPDQQSREPDDKGRLKPVDYTTLNNNNIVHQLLGQQLLGNRNSLEENDVTSKKKRSRSKKRRSGSDVTDPSSGVVSISGGVVTPLGAAAAGLTPSVVDSNSPPVVLDVVCGQNQASLSLEKLKSGSKTACVLLNGSWLTPNQYQHVSGRGTARDWKRSIKHNGTSLKALLASKVLTFDPPSCRCNLCLAISSHAKENPGAIGVHSETRVDQENEPPRRGVDGSPSAIGDGDGGGAKSPSPLIIRTSKAPTPTIVCRSRDSVETEDYDEEEEDEEEEEEEMDGEKEEDEEEEELEEEEEEEEDWEKKRSLMDALSLKELPTTTSRRLLCPADDDATKPCRKRKALALQEGGDGRRANKKKVKVKVPDGPTKEKRMKNGLGLVHLRKSSHGSEKVRRNSENDAVLCAAGSSSSVASDWTMLNTSGPSDLCRVLSASTGATSSLGTEAFKAMQQRTNGESTAPSLQKEETLTHIIHELRNYKKSLEEKIVASRRTSHVTPKEPISASGVLQSSPHLGQWSPPTGKDGPSPMFQRRVSGCSDKAKNPDAARTSASQDGCGRKDWSVKSATKLDGSDEKQLPDLVRSHNPSTITTTTSSPAAGLSVTTPRTTPCAMYSSFTPSPLTSTSHYNPIARYVIDPLTGAKYECDEHGVIDLSIGKKHPTSSNLARPIYSTLMGKMDLDCEADSEGERVLDLSVTSKVKAEHRTTTPKAATEEQRVPKRKRLSDGHSRQRGTAVQKRQSSLSSSSSWIGLSPGKILGWTETDVAKFVADVPECGIYAETFKQFRVTGPSLVCLSVDQMTAILRMRLNAAQSLRSAIDRIVAAAAATVTSA